MSPQRILEIDDAKPRQPRSAFAKDQVSGMIIPEQKALRLVFNPIEKGRPRREKRGGSGAGTGLAVRPLEIPLQNEFEFYFQRFPVKFRHTKRAVIGNREVLRGI